jgi:hypothetical protein
LINALLGQPVAKTGTGNRTTLGASKYGGGKIPGVRVTLVDSMGIEMKETARSLAASIGYGERCSKRLDPSCHLCAGMVCINSRGGKYEDMEGDLVTFFRDSNIPVIVVLTQAWDQSDSIEDQIKADPMFQDCPLVVVNSLPRTIRNRRTKVESVVEAFGLDELAAKLSECVSQGRTAAKPNALKQISSMRSKVISDESRIVSSINSRPMTQQHHVHLQSVLPQASAHLGIAIASAVSHMENEEDKLVQQFAVARQQLDEIETAVLSDDGGIRAKESRINDLLRSIEMEEHQIRMMRLNVWKAELSGYQSICDAELSSTGRQHLANMMKQ